MASFLKILNIALSAPLYLDTRMFTFFEGGVPKVLKVRYERNPLEFNLYGKNGLFYYRYFREPERFYRGLIIDKYL